MDDDRKYLEKLIREILLFLGIDSDLEIEANKEDKVFIVNIKAGEKTGLLIGNRGRTINSLQSIVNVILRIKNKDAYRVLINIADWREKEEERMRNLAIQIAERVISTGEAQNLYNLTPAQRRIVHIALADKDVKTESFGEGKDRYLVVSPK